MGSQRVNIRLDATILGGVETTALASEEIAASLQKTAALLRTIMNVGEHVHK